MMNEEFPLIQSELEAIDVKLLGAETTLFWNGKGTKATFGSPWVKIGWMEGWACPACSVFVLRHAEWLLLPSGGWVRFDCRGVVCKGKGYLCLFTRSPGSIFVPLTSGILQRLLGNHQGSPSLKTGLV